MASESIEQHANPSSAASVTFTVASGQRKIDLVIPNEETMRYVANEIFKDQCYRPVPGLPPPRTVLDIGANVGLATAYFRLIYPQAFIHCVEPDPIAWSFLVQNGPRIGNCRLHQVGLYQGDCERPFYSAMFSVMSSLARNPATPVTPSLLKLHDAGRFVAELGVERFDLIKIDTEGAEVPIIRSLAGFVSRAALVHIEFHSREDRRAIDDLMNPTHCLYHGVVEATHRGHFTYVLNALCPEEFNKARLSLEG